MTPLGAWAARARCGTLRRAGWIAAVGAVAAAAVLFDLTTRVTPGYRVSALRTYVASVEHDVAQCRDGLRDAVRAYVGSVTGTPAVAPGVPATFVTQAIAVCGFADAGVVDLGTTAPPRSIASPAVDRLAPQVDAWAYLDAFTLLQDLRQVVANPARLGPRRAFDRELALLQARRARVERLVATAEQDDGAPLRPLPLISVPALMPHGKLPATGPARP